MKKKLKIKPATTTKTKKNCIAKLLCVYCFEWYKAQHKKYRLDARIQNK